MKNRTQLLFPLLVLLVALASACSAPEGNSNSPGSANLNSAQTPLPQTGTPSAASDSGVPQTSAQANPQPSPEPAGAPAGPQTAVSAPAKADPAAVASGPKIVVPVKKIDFGLQAKDKTLVRTITVRNGGKSELKIDAVEPS
ncbi:MAG TPA: hypothetical protein VKC34_01660 [Blastocatellia bacterium]|nr:hypothetical protein [Blastocatellia bacterium]